MEYIPVALNDYFHVNNYYRMKFTVEAGRRRSIKIQHEPFDFVCTEDICSGSSFQRKIFLRCTHVLACICQGFELWLVMRPEMEELIAASDW